MCDLAKIRRVAVVLALAVASVPRGAAAQAAGEPASREALVRRIRELESRYAAAEARAGAAEAAHFAEYRRANGGQDTVLVGPLAIVTTTDQVDEARTLWSQEWAELEAILGAHAADLSHGVFVYHRKPIPYSYDVGGVARRVEFQRPVSDRTARAGIRGAIGAAATAALPPELQWWSGGVPLGTPPFRSDVYRRLVHAPTDIAQSCAKGSIQACWTAMGAMDPAADLFTTWYTPADRRGVLQAIALTGRDGARRQECLAGLDEGCLALLSRMGVHGNLTPFPGPVRASLLWFALERGGPGSLDRLIASLEPYGGAAPQGASVRTAQEALGPVTHIRDALGRAAGMDPDVLMGLWRDRILSAAPGAPTPDQPSRTNVFAWMALLAGLATRSTRWRLG